MLQICEMQQRAIFRQHPTAREEKDGVFMLSSLAKRQLCPRKEATRKNRFKYLQIENQFLCEENVLLFISKAIHYLRIWNCGATSR